MFRKILCPIDFSPGSDVALRLAARMAAAPEAELAIVHAFYLAPLVNAGEHPMPFDTVAALMEDGKRSLAATVADATNLGAKRISTRFLDGLPWDRITTFADDEECDLIVIGTHGRTGLARFMLGSVAEKVVRHAPCSVIVARTRGEAPPFRRVLCPIDFSDSSREALRRASELVAPDGSITLMHAVQLPATARTTLAPDLLSEADRKATDTLKEWAAQLSPGTKTSISTTMGLGNPAAQALAVIDEDPAYDLIAVGSHGRTGIQRMVLGSVAEKLVRHAPCSVLVARAPHAVEECTHL